MPFNNINIYVELCNLRSCSLSSTSISLSLCEEGGNEEEERVREGFDEVEKKLEGEDLDEALKLMYAIGDGVNDCSDVSVSPFHT